MPVDPGWTGRMDGPFRGSHLVPCRRHVTVWHKQESTCPVCGLERELAEARLAAIRRCEECRKSRAGAA